MGNAKIKYRAQISLETALVLGAMALLIVCAGRIWFWFGQDMAGRVVTYKDTRLRAGNNAPGEMSNYTTIPLSVFGAGQ